MSIDNRDTAIKVCLQWEGGYTNDQSDHGGATNWGITLADAKKYWKKNADADDVRTMPQDIAIDIYRSKYWKTSFYDCDKLEPGVDLAVFDFGVNSGPSRAKKALDNAVGGTAAETVAKICDERLTFLQHISNNQGQAKFLKGWTNRVKDIKAKALAMTQTPKKPSPLPAATGGAIIVTAVAGFWEQIITHPWLSAAIVVALVFLGLECYRVYKGKNNV